MIWQKAFSCNDDEDVPVPDELALDRKATIAIEHIIQ